MVFVGLMGLIPVISSGSTVVDQVTDKHLVGGSNWHQRAALNILLIRHSATILALDIHRYHSKYRR